MRYCSFLKATKDAQMQAKPKHSIAVILFDGVMPLDITGPTDALMTANYYWRKANALTGDECFYDFQFISASGPVVTGLSGLKFMADDTISEVDPSMFDALLVPGGNGVFRAAENRELIRWIRAAHKTSFRTISVCSGALLLAEAGLLDGRTGCTHWILCKELAARYPAITVDPQSLYITDGKVITSAGVTSGIDMTLALVEADLGRDIALKVARHLVVHLKRPGNQNQYSWPLKAQTASQSDAIGRAVRWITENIGEPMPLEHIAKKAGMSVRSFSRHFRTQLGDTPAKFIEQARLESARLLIEEDTTITLKHMAAASGFSSTEHMTRAFERHFGVPPADYRKAFALH